MEITVKENTNKVGTFYDITLDCGVTIYGCQRKQGTGKNGEYDFISMPQRKGTKDGKDAWFPIISVSRELSDAIHAAVTGGRQDTGGGSGYGSQEPAFDPDSEIPFLCAPHGVA